MTDVFGGAKPPKGEKPVKKKMPSPKVIGSMWVLASLDTRGGERKSLQAEGLSELCEKKITDEKAEKVVEMIDKITATFVARVKKAVDKYNGVVEKPKSKKKPEEPVEEKGSEKKKKKKKRTGA